MSEDGIRASLRRLYAEYAEDKRLAHLRADGNPLVPGVGAVRPRLMFVGEAPGTNEASQRMPFVGASGKLLDEMLTSVGIQRGEVFLTNVVKYRTIDENGFNRIPFFSERQTGYGYLRREHRLLGCPPMVVLGKHARKTAEYGYQLPDGLTIGQWCWFQADGGFPVLPLYHPAYGIYQITNRPVMFEQFQAVLRVPRSKEECDAA